ncbi:MAG: hypothetical protein KJO07_15055 [Deltaproteobacteria bacterium]|nr:hypothetical protein [Deltaproteobacteria bacterium]
MSCRQGAIALAVFLAVGFGCGEDKKSATTEVETEAEAEAEAEAKPAQPDQAPSFLSKACDEHGDGAKKANCLCRATTMSVKLGDELLAKLETAPKDGSSDEVVEHLGGMANLSKVYDAMRTATEECGKGDGK